MSEDLHRTLRRQMARCGVDFEQITDERLVTLLGRVSSAYEDADRQRYLHDRAFLLASTEMQTLYDRLEAASQSAAAVQRDRLQAVFDTAATGLIVLEDDGRIFDLNPVAETVLAMTGDEVRGKDVDDIIKPAALVDPTLKELRESITEGQSWRSSDVLIQSGSGRTLSAALLYRAMQTGGGVLAIEDITDRKNAQAELMWRANHDPLTGLFNRAALVEHIQRALQRARRYNTLVAVMFIDLDRFKRVNDTLGHAAGDTLLVECAQRIAGVMREVDTVARLGGDEFVAVCENLTNDEDARMIAQRLTDSIEEPFDIDGEAAYVECSVGIAMSDGHGVEPDGLLRDSDVALYESKQTPGSSITLYTEAMIRRIQTAVELEQRMRAAMPGNEFWVAYQPILTIADRKVIGFEALARWSSPDGEVMPEEFIPAAEPAGLLDDLGRTLVLEALSFHSTLPPGTMMFINMAPGQLAAERMLEWFDAVLAQTGADPSGLVIEITETSSLAEYDLEERLAGLRERGVRIALDDFGVGQSSLSSLHTLPVDMIKVDRSFLASAPFDNRSRAIAAMVCALGDNLGIQVVAEGVEHDQQWEFLEQVGCDYAQGFLLGPPEPAAQAVRHLA